MKKNKDRWTRASISIGWRRLWGRLKRFLVALPPVLSATFALLALLLLIVGAFYIETVWCWAHEGNASRSATLRNLGLAVGACLAAFIGLPLATWRSIVANRQAETSERGLQNERYQKGAEMLGSDTLVTRLGGIYALEHLAQEHPEDYGDPIINLSCTFAGLQTETEAESETKDAKKGESDAETPENKKPS